MSIFGSPFSKALGALLVTVVAVAVQYLETGSFVISPEVDVAVQGVLTAAVVFILKNVRDRVSKRERRGHATL